MIAALVFTVVKDRRRLRWLEKAVGTRTPGRMSMALSTRNNGISVSELPWDCFPAELQGNTVHNQPSELPVNGS